MADSTRKKAGRHQSITRHSLFPAVVVLWFGALFGLVSLAVRPALIEHLVGATGVDGIIPMAAPPLGTTARMLLALAMAALGCVIGFAVARSLAKSHPRKPPPDATFLESELEDEREPASPVGHLGRRRGLSNAGQENVSQVASDDMLARQLAPACEEQPNTLCNGVEDAGQSRNETQVLNVTELLPELEEDHADHPWAQSFHRAASRTDRSKLDDESAPRPPAPLVFMSQEGTPDTALVDGKRNRLFDAYAHAKRLRMEAEAPPTPTPTPTPTPGFASLVEEAKQDITAGTEAAGAELDRRPANASEDDAERAQDSGDAPKASSRSTAPNRIASAPLEELSHVELLERLAMALERRRAAAASQADPASDRAGSGSGISQERVDERDHAQRARDAALSSLLDLSTRMAEQTSHGSTGPHEASTTDRFAGPVVMLRAQQGAGDAGTDAQSPRQPTRGPRVFDAPASEQHDAIGTERALEDALARLQRMSGAA